MNEKTLVTGLTQTLRKELFGAVVFNHADLVTAGIPDVSVTWNGWTTWLEVKYANPSFEVTGIQNLTMRRLASQGLAWFIIYDRMTIKQTLIVHPQYIVTGTYKVHALKLPIDFPSADGFNHQSVVDFLKRVTQSEKE